MDVLLTQCRSSVSLRAPDPALSVVLQRALNDSFAVHSEFLPWAKSFTSEDEARAFMLRSVDEFTSETGERRFFIVAGDGEAIVGCIGLIPRGRNRHEVGYWANTEFAGKGYMRRALTALIGNLPGDVFYLTTSSANLASQRLAVAAGFALIRIFKRARHTERHGVQDTYLYRLKGA